MGAISQQTSPLPSESLSYPSPTQDPVAPPKRVVVERKAALRLRLLPCITPASKNQVRPSSGCRQGAISLQTSPLPSESLSYPSPTQDPVAPPKQVVVGRTAALRLRLCYCLTTASKIRFNPARGADMGEISQQTSPLPSDSLPYPSPIQDPVAQPKRVVFGRTAALRPRLRLYLTPASKKQVQPSSGCRQGGNFTTNLAAAL
jgi:hypothetical protein